MMPKKVWSGRKRMGFQKLMLIGLRTEWVRRSFGRNSEGNRSIGELTVTERSVLKAQQQTTLMQRKH